MKLIQDVCHEAALKYGEKIAFDSVTQQTAFKEFILRTESVAGGLDNLGVRKGDRIAILAENCMDYIVYHYATAMTGGILVPLNIRHTDIEMLWILNNSEPGVLVIDKNLSGHLDTLKNGCSSIKFTIGIGSVSGTEYSTDDFVETNLAIKNPPILHPNEPVLLIYTSGTTGRPKGALHSHEAINHMDAITSDIWKISEKDVFLGFMPYFHLGGIVRSSTTLINGATNVVAGKMNVEKVTALLIEKKVTIVKLPQPIDKRLFEIAEKDNLEFPALRIFIGLGGHGPHHAQWVKKLCKRFGCEYRGSYGQTETFQVVNLKGEDYFKDPYTCGKVMQSVEVATWDDKNQPIPLGTVGEIVVRSKSNMIGYWKNDEANKKVFTEGWLHTGDLGKLDEQGYLYFVGRKKVLIKTGGENVYPKEVESVLLQNPLIADLAVIGIPDEVWGETVAVAIVPRTEARITIDDVKSFCEGEIAAYKIPKKLIIVERIPRDFSGKIIIDELRNKFNSRGNSYNSSV